MGILSSIGSMFGPVGAAVGGLFDNDRNSRSAADQRQADERGAERQMDFQREEASTARGWYEQMAGTAHQRQQLDLKAAGLNPILSGTGGSGAASTMAPSPSGSKATASMQAPSTGLGAVVAAQQARRLDQELENMKASKDLTDQQLKTEKWRTRSEFENIYQVYENWMNKKQQTFSEEQQTEILKEQLKGIKLEGKIDESTYGEIMRYINRASNATNSAQHLRGLFRQR